METGCADSAGCGGWAIGNAASGGVADNAASGVSDAVHIGAGDAASIKRLWLVLAPRSVQQKG